MNSLEKAVALLALDIHPDTAVAVAKALEQSIHDDPMDVLRKSLGGASGKLLSSIEAACAEEAGLSARDLAKMIRGASAVATLKNREETELVWTGPATGIVPIRKTEQVLIGLIEASRRELFIVSFVAYGADAIMKSLVKATARGVNVKILLERSQSQGGTLDFDAISKVRSVVSGAEFFIWDGEGADEGKPGSVHAKCAVADGESAFVTSANLTGAAMDRNMEMGILVRRGELPKQLQRHLQALLTTKTIRRIDG